MKQQYVATFKDKVHATQAVTRLLQLMYSDIQQIEAQVYFTAYKMPSEQIRRDIGASTINEKRIEL